MSRRGSVLLYVVLLLVAMTTIVVALSSLTSASLVNSVRFERQTGARLAFEGATDKILCDWLKGIITVPSTQTVTVNGMSVSADIGPGPVARTLRISGSVTNRDWKYRFSNVVGQRVAAHPIFFALFAENYVSARENLTLGSAGANGDMYAGELRFPSAGRAQVNGDLDSVAPVDPTKLSYLAGTLWAPAPAISFPKTTLVDGLTYELASDSTRTGRIRDPSFAATGTSFYRLIYARPITIGGLSIQAVTIEGVVTGKGVIFVDGNCFVENITYANADSRLVVIARGDIHWERDNTTYGHFYCTGSFRPPDSDNNARTILGSVACGSFETRDAPCTIIHDPYFWNNPQEAVKYRIPGYWP